MTIDPRVGMYLNMIVGILTGLLGAAAMFTDLVGAQLSLKIIAGLGIALIVANGILHAIPSKAGAAEQFPLGPKVIAFLAVLLTGFLITGVGPATAATKAAPKVCDPMKLLPGCKPAAGSPSTTSASPITDAIDKIINQVKTSNADFISGVVGALNEADADASTIVVPAIGSAPAQVKDPISHACYPAQIQYLQSLPTAKSINAPAPYDVIVLFQYKRDLVNLLLSGQLIPAYLKVGCSALLGNEAAIFAATLGLVGIGATTIGPITAFAGSFGAAAISLPAISALIAIPK